MKTINNYIENTILKADATKEEIETLAKEAKEFNFLGVCVNLNYLELTYDFLKDSNAKIVTVVNFPLANSPISIIQKQTELALKLGADEIDTVLNISALKNKNFKKVEDDIRKTKEICNNNILKVILETDLLTKEEIITACKCAISANADFVKTSTGFVKNGIGATEENVKLMYETVNPFGLKVKASGGIKNLNQAIALIEAGAQRLGTSSGTKIILEALGEKND